MNPVIFVSVQDGIFHVDILLNSQPWSDEQPVNDLQIWEEQVKISTTAKHFQIETFKNIYIAG